jgi:hypothetical protein
MAADRDRADGEGAVRVGDEGLSGPVGRALGCTWPRSRLPCVPRRLAFPAVAGRAVAEGGNPARVA